MNKLLLPLALIALQFFFSALGWFSWSLFDGPLALVVMFAFFHSLDTRNAVFYAVLCGLCRDLFSLDVFGLSALTYVVIVFMVLFTTRFINRHNGFFVFPVIFIASLSAPYLGAVMKAFFAETAVSSSAGIFFSRSLLQAVGTTALALPLYLLSKPCGLGLTEL
jgi:rod shape-determining protein MreD